MASAVIFDFFGVIVTEGLKQFLDKYLGEDIGKRRYATSIVQRYDTGAQVMTFDDLVAELSEITKIEKDTVSDYICNNRPNRELLEYIRYNLKPNYKTSILSNAGTDWIAQLLDNDDVELFDDIVLSYRYGVTKPNPSIYKLAAKRLHLLPRDCVFVDDTLGHCQGAKLAGMHAIQYRNFHQFKRELRVYLAAAAKY
jgi:HAD superfamily hydrolase (TIGR01509 family)